MNTFWILLKSLFGRFSPRRRNRESFGRLFNSFREVLERNNRSLEIITEMGDTLGGDYLFDIQYVRRSYGRLHTAMTESLDSFDRLTRDRYARLRNRFNDIDEQIRRVIDEAAASDELIIFYENIRPGMINAVGGKNSNLAEVKNSLRLPVPDAFAITTRAFDVFMRHNRIFEKAPGPGSGTPASESVHELHEQMLHGEMPEELSRAIGKAIKKIRSRCGSSCSLAVRSSAGEEDGDFSFAGQFETVLNVPLERNAVEKAYRKVAASLFSEKASAYQSRIGYDVNDMKMAVACVVMVNASASGVLYSSDPEGKGNEAVINAAWGLGSAVVEGSTDADLYRVEKGESARVTESRTGAKESMVVMAGDGVAVTATTADKKNEAALSHAQVLELARIASLIEKHFRGPQDVEWAVDGKGKIYVLQARPLRLPEQLSCPPIPDASAGRVIARNRGLVVQKGVAAGPVFIVKNERQLDFVPRGAVLVARHDSSHFVRVMTGVSAIITDIGTPTSHMATLCREFKIPTIVNAGNATQLLNQGQEVTVQVDSEGAVLYEGTVTQLLQCSQEQTVKLEELLEFRRKRYLLRYIAPLNLIDPLRDEFSPKACRTMHDILRFIHEKSVAELIESAEGGVRSGTVKLELPVPAGIMVIDIGGGLNNPEGKKQVFPEQVTSLPLRAIVTGMTAPGVWRSDAVPLRVNDFLTSMLRVPDITTDAGGRVETNMAVISRQYANISLKFGYHFIILDCYCSENTRNNHIYFRFAGGATDISKRSRRLQLLAAILGEYGFNIKTKGDLIVARLANIEQAEAEKLLDQMGRLFSYTRQLDAVLNDDAAVERYTRSFLEGKYELAEATKK